MTVSQWQQSEAIRRLGCGSSKDDDLKGTVKIDGMYQVVVAILPSDIARLHIY